MELTREDLDRAIEATGAEVSERPDYSGRAMYGRTCLGVVGSTGEITKFLMGVASLDLDLAVEMADNMRTDNMGLDMIAYFPDVEFIEDDEL